MNPAVDLAPLLNVGAVGAILVYHLIMIVPRLDRIERAIDRATRAHMIDVMSRSDTPEIVRIQAASINRQIERRYKMDDENGGDL